MYHFVPFTDMQDCARKTVHFITAGRIALSGGTTYTQIFPLWAALEPDCRKSSFFPVDERVVPLDDPGSNWGEAYRSLLRPLGKDKDLGHFASSAKAYENILKAEFGQAGPVFDCIFLGVGGDGHTASLFPGSTYLDDTVSTVLHTVSPLPPTERVSLAPRVLASAHDLIVIISGSQKKPIVEAIRNGRDDLPIVKILSRRAQSTLYVEQSLLD
jgi:6-phosphogluconolactonase